MESILFKLLDVSVSIGVMGLMLYVFAKYIKAKDAYIARLVEDLRNMNTNQIKAMEQVVDALKELKEEIQSLKRQRS